MGKKKKTFMGINPKHKGYCTPMSKPTCTPRRKALAKRLKPGGDLYKGKKKRYGGPLKELNDMQFARKGVAVGSMLEGGRIIYNEGGPYESFNISDVQRPAIDAKGNRHSPYTTAELVDDIDLRNTKQRIKNARFAKGTIKRRISDGMLLKGSPEHKALKKIFKDERKKGSYKRSNYFYHPKNR